MFDKMGAMLVIFRFFSHLNIKKQHLSRNNRMWKVCFQ